MNSGAINVYQKNVKGVPIEPLKFRLFPVMKGSCVSPSESPRGLVIKKTQASQMEVEVSIGTLVFMFLPALYPSLPSQRSTPNSEGACTTWSCPQFTRSY